MKLLSETEYEAVMAQILELMNIGESNLSDAQSDILRALALQAQNYEHKIYPKQAPTTLEGMIELRMYEMKLNKTGLAKTLKISNTKLSMILAGKQKPDALFLKSIYQQLHVSADFILEHI